MEEMEYELVIEKERVRKVISEYEELHPPKLMNHALYVSRGYTYSFIS